jgi:WD40 repeat protein
MRRLENNKVVVDHDLIKVQKHKEYTKELFKDSSYGYPTALRVCNIFTYVGMSKGSVLMYNSNYAMVKSLNGTESTAVVTCIDLTLKEDYVLFGREDGTIEVWDSHAGLIIKSIKPSIHTEKRNGFYSPGIHSLFFLQDNHNEFIASNYYVRFYSFTDQGRGFALPSIKCDGIPSLRHFEAI